MPHGARIGSVTRPRRRAADRARVWDLVLAPHRGGAVCGVLERPARRGRESRRAHSKGLPCVVYSLECQAMSRKRHAGSDAAEPGLSVRTLALTYPSGFHQPPHSHDWPQLVYAASGVLTVTTAAGAWVVPPQRAVWVPADTRHQLDTTGETALRTLYLHPRVAPALAAGCAVVHITPLVRELVLHIVAAGPLEFDRPEHTHLLAVLIDQLKTLDQAPLSVPLPRDPRARRVAERVLARASQADTLDELAAGSGASARTLERLFRAETGLPFGRWRQQARLLGALRLLGEGLAVTAVAARVGYRSPSAFVAMFTRALGRSPGRYFESSASG